MTIKVRMWPHLDDLEEAHPSGIDTVVRKYFKHLPAQGIELVKRNSTSYDLAAIHAAAATDLLAGGPIVSHCHGLYFTEDYALEGWEPAVNRAVIDVIRHAKLVTVPSRWVAELFKRDMHLSPAILPHGVDWAEWQGGSNRGYILWNKNRTSDACDPGAVTALAALLPDQKFVTTFSNGDELPNVQVVGTLQHPAMRDLVKGANVYLATAKETFGVGTLEALAAGVPVLGWDWGGTADLVVHGRSGYLAQLGDYDELVYGATYILQHRQAMSDHARAWAATRGWDYVAELVAKQYADTLGNIQDEQARPMQIDPALYQREVLQ